MEKELLFKIAEFLKTYGLRSATMDDIAKHLKMSKKTLYKSFKDKTDIINQIMGFQCQMESCMIKEITDNSENAIDEIIKINNLVSKTLSSVNPSVLFDLEKYYPEAFSLFRNHKDTFIASFIEENLKRGMNEGLYRANLNTELVMRFYLKILENLWSPEIINHGDFSITQIHSEMARYHIRGISSEKGHQYLNQLINSGEFNII
jgi:AcrR family transcriptional regulator